MDGGAWRAGPITAASLLPAPSLHSRVTVLQDKLATSHSLAQEPSMAPPAFGNMVPDDFS